jgi:ribose 5-phosphate isomerase B
MKVLIAADHAGFELKTQLINSEIFKSLNIAIEDLGPMDVQSVDYPDYAKLVAKRVNEDVNLQGILICGSGQGMSITANKFPKVRAALCLDENMATLARAHNNANILCLGSRLSSFELAKKILKAFFKTPFEGGRHQTRVDKIC